MSVWPVIVRELRQQSRQKATFTMRCAGAGLTTLTAGLIAPGMMPGSNVGGFLFSGLHFTIFFAIWVLVPLTASDCISRERREGTLGLLFLTPLGARDIVFAKAAVHGLRSLTVLLAVLPVMMISVLLGGVSWQQASLSAFTNLAALCWALGVTLIASSGTRSSLRALVAALVFTIWAMILQALVLGMVSAPGIFYTGNLLGFLDERLLYGFAPMPMNPVPMGMGRGAGVVGQLLSGAVMGALIALLFLYLAICFAAARVRRTWRDEPAPQWVQNAQKAFCTPVVAIGLFKRWMRWKIERNPVGWLEQRTWTGRLVTWTWFAVVISIYSAVFTDNNFLRDFRPVQYLISWLMMGSVAMSAAGSFRRERESGVMELLLVSPLSAANLIEGRLRGLWGQFLPATAMLLIVWVYFQSILRQYGDLGMVLFFGATFLTIPIVGLYFSLRCRSFIAAYLLTLSLGLVLPAVLPGLLFRATMFLGLLPPGLGPSWQQKSLFDDAWQSLAGVITLQLLLAAWLWHSLHRRLETRNFPLERTGP